MKKQIYQLQGDAGMVEDNKGMLDIAVKYYKDLFCKEPCLDIDLMNGFWDLEDMLSQQHNDMLDAPFSEKEVKDAIFGSYAEGAPGPDVFIFLFINIFGSSLELISWTWLRIGMRGSLIFID
jgi:hypothetical protein